MKEKGHAGILFLFILFAFPLMVLLLFLRSREAHKYMDLKIKQTELQILQYQTTNRAEQGADNEQ